MAGADVTQLLGLVNRGQPGSRSRLVDAVYQELRVMARRRMAGESPDHTLQPTALAHDAYVRLIGNPNPNWENRRHFFTAAAEAMRRILIDHARAKGTAKRGGDHDRVEFEGIEVETEGLSTDLVALGEALDDLAREDARAAQIVEFRYLLGMTISETAEVLEVSPRTVTADWHYAKAWLTHRLRD